MAVCERCGEELRRHEMPAPLQNIIAEVGGLPRVPRRLLGILWQRGRNEPVSRDVLMSLMYGHEPDPPYDATMRQHIYYLRKRLRNSSMQIASKSRDGWQLVLSSRERSDDISRS